MQAVHFETFGPHHLLYLAGTAAVYASVVAAGRRMEGAARRRLGLSLVGVALVQEITWDVVGMLAGVWQAAEHLPLHLCSLALFVGAYAVVTRRQLAFETAYFWGTVATSQALLTPDPGRWALGEFDVFWNFLSHGIILLMVVWLVFVEGMRVRRGAWLRVLALTHAAAAVVGLIDWATGFNYFYLSRKPGGDSPFLVGEWPVYILGFEVLAVVFFFLAEKALLLAGPGNAMATPLLAGEASEA